MDMVDEREEAFFRAIASDTVSDRPEKTEKRSTRPRRSVEKFPATGNLTPPQADPVRPLKTRLVRGHSRQIRRALFAIYAPPLP